MANLRELLDSLPIIVPKTDVGTHRAIGRQSMGEFNDRVYETVRRVPRGKVVSYGQVARLIGSPGRRGSSGMPCMGIPIRGIARLRRGFLVIAWCSRTVRLRPGFCVRRADEQRARLAAEGVTFWTMGASTCGLASGMAGTLGARTAARRPMGRPRRRSISIGLLSWANERLVLRRLS